MKQSFYFLIINFILLPLVTICPDPIFDIDQTPDKSEKDRSVKKITFEEAEAFQRIQEREHLRTEYKNQNPLDANVVKSTTTHVDPKTKLTFSEEKLPSASERYFAARMKQAIMKTAYNSVIFDEPAQLNLSEEDIANIKENWTIEQKQELMNKWAQKVIDIFYNAKLKPIDNMLTIIRELKKLNIQLQETHSLEFRIINENSSLQTHLEDQIYELKRRLIKQYKAFFPQKTYPQWVTDLDPKTTTLPQLPKIFEPAIRELLTRQQEKKNNLQKLCVDQAKEFEKLCKSNELILLQKITTQTDFQKTPMFTLSNTDDFDTTD